MLEVKDKKIS